MTDPLSLLPLALAARGGSVDGRPASQCVAAGLTLLQRAAPLVRALAGRRSAILLPRSAHFLTALGASEGRSALLLDASAGEAELLAELELGDVGALFTLSHLLPPVQDVAVVLLDDAPRRARVQAGGRSWEVDLGAHFPLDLAGDADANGSDEEVAAVFALDPERSRVLQPFTHRDLLRSAREHAAALSLVPGDRVLAALSWTHPRTFALACAAPLLAGASIHTLSVAGPDAAVESIRRHAITALVAGAELFDALLQSDAHSAACSGLRVCWSPANAGAALASRWEGATGVPLALF